jgi:hypothetical protein
MVLIGIDPYPYLGLYHPNSQATLLAIA